MEAFTVTAAEPGKPPLIRKGIRLSPEKRVTLGRLETKEPQATIPLSHALARSLPEGTTTVSNASVMRSGTELTFLATENVASDPSCAVLVMISVPPAPGGKTVITRAEISTSRCHYRGLSAQEEKACEECGTVYAPDPQTSAAASPSYRHPQSGHRRYYNEHLSHHVRTVAEASHLEAGHETHKDLLVVMTPGARVRIALITGGRPAEEFVLVRTHTELGFAHPGSVYLENELSEEHAAYI